MAGHESLCKACEVRWGGPERKRVWKGSREEPEQASEAGKGRVGHRRLSGHAEDFDCGLEKMGTTE